MSKFTEEEKSLICDQAGEILWKKVEAAQHNDHHVVVRTQIDGRTVCISTAFLAYSHEEIPCDLIKHILPKGPCGIYQLSITDPSHRGVGLFTTHSKIITDWLLPFRAKIFAVLWQYPNGEIPGKTCLETLGYELKPESIQRRPECGSQPPYCPLKIPHPCGCQIRLMEKPLHHKKT